jgi:uncharacterized integral membrane protein
VFKRIIRRAIGLFAALVSVVLAIANRQDVSLSFDPFSDTDPAIEVLMPLYLVILLSIFLGVLIGGMTSWIGAGRARKQARAFRRTQKSQTKNLDRKTEPETTSLPSEIAP